MSDQLTFKPAHRKRTRCDYHDYFINGKRLADILDIGDFIPPFGWLDSEAEKHFAEMLLGDKPSDLRAGRIPLFVCPECVDYGCGVGTCQVEVKDNEVIWREFGWETNYEEELNQEDIDKTLVLSFDILEYQELFQKTNKENKSQ